QDRGFYFLNSRHEGETLILELGDPSHVSETVLTGAPDAILRWDPKEFQGQLLTPATLKSIAARVEEVLGTQGYACPELQTQADPTTGRIDIHVSDAEKVVWADVEENKVKDLLPGTLRRYDAFRIGDPYDSEMLRLTTQRTIESGVVRNTFFNVHCKDGKAIAQQRIFAGKPRELRLGVGFNTDLGALLRAQWSHARLGPRGSKFSASLEASYMGYLFNTQEAKLESQWYVLSQPSRFHLRPALTVRHESNNRGDTLTATARLNPTMTWDTRSAGYFVSVGPQLNGVRTFRGPGRLQSYFLAAELDFRVTSHEFELNRAAPQMGYEWTLTGSFSQKDILADFSSEMLQTRFTWLIPSHRYGARKVIFGFRGGLSTTFVRQSEGGISNLPTNLRHYLGGTTTLRGFGPRELPGPNGGLTSLFLGAEMRAADYLPWGIQPLVFVDAGSVGTDAFSLDPTWYLSPGAGVRWQSPIGVFRATVAPGFALKSPVQNHPVKFHFTYGEEF
ncbi:BamA/TamA family outer membrane protein, partial [bacterium]|nr:BamA/TamA family outer membrane protein [bacterium]